MPIVRLQQCFVGLCATEQDENLQEDRTWRAILLQPTMAQTVDAIELQRPGESHTDIGSVDQASKRNDAYTNDLEAPLTSAEVEDVPPNGGYAWVCCGAVFFINIFTWGPTSVSVEHVKTRDVDADVRRHGRSSSPIISRNQPSLMARNSPMLSSAGYRSLKP